MGEQQLLRDTRERGRGPLNQRRYKPELSEGEGADIAHGLRDCAADQEVTSAMSSGGDFREAACSGLAPQL